MAFPKQKGIPGVFMAHCESYKLICSWKEDKVNSEWSVEGDFLHRTGHILPNVALEV